MTELTERIQLTCSKCGHVYERSAEHEGKLTECPSCKARQVIKRADGSARRSSTVVTTTPTLQGHEIKEYLGVVSAEAVVGVNVFRDILAGVRDIVGGRSGTLEKALTQAREAAMEDLRLKASKLGANAVVGLTLDYETLGDRGGMLMVVATGTAVIAE